MKQISISEQKLVDGIQFPLAFGPESEQTLQDCIDYVQSNKDQILTELRHHGAILFRGFPINDPKDFNDFCLAFGWKDLPYIGGAAVRTNVYGVVFTA